MQLGSLVHVSVCVLHRELLSISRRANTALCLMNVESGGMRCSYPVCTVLKLHIGWSAHEVCTRHAKLVDCSIQDIGALAYCAVLVPCCGAHFCQRGVISRSVGAAGQMRLFAGWRGRTQIRGRTNALHPTSSAFGST